jgi:hypothetical protein
VVPPKIALIVLYRCISRQTPLYDIKKLIGENQSKEKWHFATSATVKKVLSSISLITISPKCLAFHRAHENKPKRFIAG